MCIKKVKNNKNILQKTFYGNQFAISEFFIHPEGYHIHKKMILLYLNNLSESVTLLIFSALNN